MPKRPTLSQYPHLHSILRNDPVANQQFNAAVSGLSLPRGSTNANQMESALNSARQKVQEQAEEIAKFEAIRKRLTGFISLLGEVIESQVKLDAYSSDIDTRRKYSIVFTPDQIRLALRMHWDILAHSMENSIVRIVGIADPADERRGVDVDAGEL